MELTAGRKRIGSKWVFKKKMNAEGKVAYIRLILSVFVSFDFEVE